MPFRREPDPIKNAERALDALDKNPLTKTPTPQKATKPFNG